MRECRDALSSLCYTVESDFQTAANPNPCEEERALIKRLDAEIASGNGALSECWWTETGEMWETSCKNAFVLNDGTPRHNKMKFCCYCGGKLKQTPTRPDR